MEVFMAILVCFLAVYGVFQLLYNIAVTLSKSDKTKLNHIHRLITVSDDIEGLEAYIRSVELTIKEGEFIILLNCTNNDIAQRYLDIIKEDFSYVKVMLPDEYEEYIDKLICQVDK